MAIRDGDYLKGRFGDGARPVGADFADLIDSCINHALSADLAGARKDLLEKIELSDNELTTIVNNIHAALTAEDVYLKYVDELIQAKLTEAENDINANADNIQQLTTTQTDNLTSLENIKHQVKENTESLSNGITTSIQVGEECNPVHLQIKDGLIVGYTSNSITYPVVPTPTPTVTLTPTATPEPTPTYVPITPSPTPTVTLSPTPTPSPTPTGPLYQGIWESKHYNFNDEVCWNDQLWKATSCNGTDIDDIPGESIHWELVSDVRYPCHSPTPTPTPTPTASLLPWYPDCLWEPRAYEHGSIVCRDGRYWIACPQKGTEADDVPGVSVHWTLYKVGIMGVTPTPTPTELVGEFVPCFPTPTPTLTPTPSPTDKSSEFELCITPTPTPTPTITFTATPTPTPTLSPTPEPTPTPTVELFKGYWSGVTYPENSIVCYNNESAGISGKWQTYSCNGTDPDDVPGDSIHWTLIESLMCPTPTPTSVLDEFELCITPTPTPTPTEPPYMGRWEPIYYTHGSIVCHEDKKWIACPVEGVEADDVPGVSVHWTYYEDYICNTPTPTPTPTQLGYFGIWQSGIEYPHGAIVCWNDNLYTTDSCRYTDGNDEPGVSIHWQLIREHDCDMFPGTPITPPEVGCLEIELRDATPLTVSLPATCACEYTTCAVFSHDGQIWSGNIVRTDDTLQIQGVSADLHDPGVRTYNLGESDTADILISEEHMIAFHIEVNLVTDNTILFSIRPTSAYYSITPTPTPTISPTRDFDARVQGHWEAKHYDKHDIVCYQDGVYSACSDSGAEADDIPGESNHWHHLQDDPNGLICSKGEEYAPCYPTPTPTPTPTVSPTPTVTPPPTPTPTPTPTEPPAPGS